LRGTIILRNKTAKKRPKREQIPLLSLKKYCIELFYRLYLPIDKGKCRPKKEVNGKSNSKNYKTGKSNHPQVLTIMPNRSMQSWRMTVIKI
jgi:hypothetical protein